MPFEIDERTKAPLTEEPFLLSRRVALRKQSTFCRYDNSPGALLESKQLEDALFLLAFEFVNVFFDDRFFNAGFLH